MAKKKGGNKGAAAKNAAENTVSSPTGTVPEAENSIAAESSIGEEPSQQQLDAAPAEAQPEPVAAPATSNASNAEADELRRELAEARAQIAALNAEVQRLKASQSAAVAVDAGKTSDLDALTQRIANLKSEQAEADAARDAAWKQLKNVVADIARLAAPDQGIKAGTPTAASATGFGVAAC